MLEVDIEEKACKAIKKTMGVLSLKLNVRGYTGWPDRMFIIPGGRPLFIEFKLPGERPTERQEYVHEILRSSGYEVQVHDTIRGATSAVAQALDAARLSEKGR